jgi:DNA-binding NtrC family response regulator
MKITVEREGASMTLECDDSAVSFPLQDLLCDMERSIIDHLLGKFSGVKVRVSEFLELNRTTLVEKCRKYGFPLKK